MYFMYLKYIFIFKYIYVLNTSANGNDSMAMGSLSEDTLKRHSAALNCCLFPKVNSLKLDEVKLVATSSDILLCYLVISERFRVSAIKCILYFNYFC